MCDRHTKKLMSSSDSVEGHTVSARRIPRSDIDMRRMPQPFDSLGIPKNHSSPMRCIHDFSKRLANQILTPCIQCQGRILGGGFDLAHLLGLMFRPCKGRDIFVLLEGVVSSAMPLRMPLANRDTTLASPAVTRRRHVICKWTTFA